MPEDMIGRLLPESIGPAIHVEKRALREIRSALQARTSSAAIALTASALVFACLPPKLSPLTSALQQGGVWLAALLSLASLGFWWRFLRACARLRGSGLRRPRGNRARAAWVLAGVMASWAVAGTIFAALGFTLRNYALAALPGLLLAGWLGERLQQIPDVETGKQEERRRMSILQNEDD